MATSINSEKQCRCVLLLTKAGGEMLRGLVMDSVCASGLSLDDFLNAHKFRITHVSRDRKRNIRWAEDVLFPPDGSKTDIHKWELNVLCFIVVDVCTLVGNLPLTIVDNVEDLKSLRNKLYHAADMTDDEYEQCAVQLENKVITSCKELNNAALLTRVEGIVKSIKSDPLSFGEYASILRTWYDMEWEISERLIGLSNDNKEINRKLDLLIQNTCPNMKPSGLQFIIQINDSQREREVAEILVKMINDYIQKRMKVQHTESSTQVKRSSPDDGHDEEHKSSKATEANTIKKRKIQMKETDSEKSSETNVSLQLKNSPESKEPSLKCVKQELELVLNEFCKDGTVIIKCDKGSVHLIIQCLSFANLMNKITECLEGKTTTLFIPVQTALRQLKGCEQICLDVILMKTCYWECIKQTVDCVEECIHAAPRTVASSVENVSPEAEDKSNHEKLYISVQSAASSTALEDMRKRCCSVEMMQKITRLTDAIKNHFETKNLALEIEVHKLPLLDSDEGVVLSTYPTSPRETVSNSGQPALVYTSTTSSSLPVVTISSKQSHPSRLASVSYSRPTLNQFTSSSSMFETGGSPITTASQDDNRASSPDTHSQSAESSSTMFETVGGKTDTPRSSASRDDNQASSREPHSQSAESSSSMFEIVRGKTDRPGSSASRDDTRALRREPHSQSAESSSSMFEIVKGKTDKPRSPASRDDNQASSREPHSQSAESSSSMFEIVRGKTDTPRSSASRDDNQASSREPHSQSAESSSSMFEIVRGKTDRPGSSASRDDTRALRREPHSQSAESSSSMFEIVKGKTDKPRSPASRDDNQASSREPHSQSAESSSSMFEIVRGKTDTPHSSASRDDNQASCREPHSESAESSSSLFHPMGGTFDTPHWPSQTDVGPSETGFKRDSYLKLFRSQDQVIEANMEKYRSLICRCICEPHVVDDLFWTLKDIHILREDLGEVKHFNHDNPQRAVEELISLVYQSPAPGKWTGFAKSIGMAGYPYLEDLLLENKPYHEDRHYQKLLFHIFNRSLEKELQVRDVIPELRACNAITDISMQQVLTALEQKGNTYATVVLLDRMQCRKANLWYPEFLNILHRLGYQKLVKTVEPIFPDLAFYSPSPDQVIEANMEKYRSLICRCICKPHVVDDLFWTLKDIHILRREDLGEVKLFNHDNPQRAVEELISLVYQSPAPGKWTGFAKSIGMAGYPYLEDLLLENKPYHEDRHYQKLLFHIFNRSLEKELQVRDVIPELRACNAITDISMQQVLTALEQKGNTYATVVLLDRMQCRKANLWYPEFLNILHRLGYQKLVKTVEPIFPDLAFYSPSPEMQLYQQQQSTSLEREQKMHEWEQNMQKLEELVQKMHELEQPLDQVNRPFRHQQLMEQLLMAKKQKLAEQQKALEQQLAEQQKWDEQKRAEQQKQLEQLAMQQKWAEQMGAEQQKQLEKAVKQLQAMQRKRLEQQRKRLEQLQAEHG